MACLASACATQTYRAKPIEPAQLAASFGERNLDSAALHAYMLAQGYPQGALPIKQWGLRELTLAAFFYHPQLDAARARWNAARAEEISAGQKPNPAVAGNAEHHSRADGGISPWTLGISLDIPIETGGKRQARIDRAASLSQAARIEIGQTAWLVRSRLHSSLIEYSSALRQSELLHREAALHGEIVQMLQNRLQAGMVSDIDLGNARLQLQKTQHALAAENSRLPELRAAVASMTGLPAHALDTVLLKTSPEPVPAGSLPTEAVQRAALLNRLDIRSALARYDAAEARLRLEIARQRPDIVLSPGYSFDQGDNRWSLGLSLILALLHNNEGPIAEASAQRELEGRQFEALQMRVIGEQEMALAHYRAALEEAEQAGKLLAAQRQQLERSERQFEAGYIDRLELTVARLEVLAAEQGLFAVSIKSQRALAALEDAVQRPLDGTPLPALPEQANIEESQS